MYLYILNQVHMFEVDNLMSKMILCRSFQTTMVEGTDIQYTAILERI